MTAAIREDDKWPRAAAPGRHLVEALSAEVDRALLSAGINRVMAQRLADIKVICETYLNADEAVEDVLLATEGRPPKHGLMLR